MILDSLPARMSVARTVETVDTVPNRFLRFVLESWRALAESVFRMSRRSKGQRECEASARLRRFATSSTSFWAIHSFVRSGHSQCSRATTRCFAGGMATDRSLRQQL